MERCWPESASHRAAGSSAGTPRRCARRSTGRTRRSAGTGDTPSCCRPADRSPLRLGPLDDVGDQPVQRLGAALDLAARRIVAFEEEAAALPERLTGVLVQNLHGHGDLHQPPGDRWGVPFLALV